MTGWENKIWGRTRCTVSFEYYSRHELEIVKAGFCSFHYHQFRANRFIVQSGHLRVVTVIGFTAKGYTIGPGESIDVASLVAHQFQAITPVVCVEEYWGDRGGRVIDADIVRFTTGGIAEGEECVAVGIQLDPFHWTGNDIRMVLPL